MRHDAKDVPSRAAAHGRKQTELVVRAQTMIGLDIVVSHGEECEGTIRREDRVTIDHRGPRRLDRPPFRNLDLEPLVPGGFTVPGKEMDSNPHDETA